MMDREQLRVCDVPEGTKTHVPVPHIELVERMEVGLAEYGWRVTEEAFATQKEDMRFFGIMDIVQGADPGENAPIPAKEFSTCIGIRNSHDKSLAISMCAGTNTFVCDNLAFAAQLIVSRKHTANVYTDMDVLVSRSMARLSATFVSMDTRAEAYKAHPITDAYAEAFILRAAFDHNIVGATRMKAVLNEWRESRYPEHNEMPQDAWRLLQAFTSVMKPEKEQELLTMSDRTAPLFRELDQTTGIIDQIDTILEGEEVEVIQR
jgi:hypothetical protein